MPYTTALQQKVISYCNALLFNALLLGGSEVKNNTNTVPFLAQTDRFLSLDLNVLSRAAGFNLVVSVFFFLKAVPLTDII